MHCTKDSSLGDIKFQVILVFYFVLLEDMLFKTINRSGKDLTAISGKPDTYVHSLSVYSTNWHACTISSLLSWCGSIDTNILKVCTKAIQSEIFRYKPILMWISFFVLLKTNIHRNSKGFWEFYQGLLRFTILTQVSCICNTRRSKSKLPKGSTRFLSLVLSGMSSLVSSELWFLSHLLGANWRCTSSVKPTLHSARVSLPSLMSAGYVSEYWLLSFSLYGSSTSGSVMWWILGSVKVRITLQCWIRL